MGLVSTTTFAQQNELKKANEAFGKVDALRGTPLAAASLNEAKTSIDKASVHDKTKDMPLTYALKGVIYAFLAAQDTVDATSKPNFDIADAALTKAEQVDTKKEFKSYVENGRQNLAQYQLNKGVKDYQAKRYNEAYDAFNYYRTVMPEDTNAIYYTALAARQSNKPVEAINNYKKLVTTAYSKKEDIYMDISTMYLGQKDTVTALKTVGEGIEKFPNSSELRKREIEIGLLTGKQQEIIGKIEAAIANDPKNKSLYYYAGLTNAQFADATANKLRKETDATKKAVIVAQRTKDFAKAAEMFKKALEIDPNYTDAILNLGYATLSPGIDMYNAANQLTKQKDYDVAMAKATAQLELAKPWIMKAVELQPKSEDALANLKLYYLGTKNTAQANETQKKIDALKAK